MYEAWLVTLLSITVGVRIVERFCILVGSSTPSGIIWAVILNGWLGSFDHGPLLQAGLLRIHPCPLSKRSHQSASILPGVESGLQAEHVARGNSHTQLSLSSGPTLAIPVQPDVRLVGLPTEPWRRSGMPSTSGMCLYSSLMSRYLLRVKRTIYRTVGSVTAEGGFLHPVAVAFWAENGTVSATCCQANTSANEVWRRSGMLSPFAAFVCICP